MLKGEEVSRGLGGGRLRELGQVENNRLVPDKLSPILTDSRQDFNKLGDALLPEPVDEITQTDAVLCLFFFRLTLNHEPELEHEVLLCQPSAAFEGRGWGKDVLLAIRSILSRCLCEK